MGLESLMPAKQLTKGHKQGIKPVYANHNYSSKSCHKLFLAIEPSFMLTYFLF